MRLRNTLKNTVPGMYQRASVAYTTVNLVSEILRRKIDSQLLRDVITKTGGTSQKECPLCHFTGFFKAFGSPPRWDAQCPSCGSLERHRFLALLLDNTPSILTSGARLLHFAPEVCIAKLLERSGVQYTSADLMRADVDLNLNIENIDITDAQYDIIVCSHVLEHVNDRAALAELRRILKADGIIIIMVPIIDGCELTYEDSTITDSNDRLIHFGQEDHVRIYGADFVRRLTDAGLRVDIHTAGGKESVKFGLSMGEKIFLCSKAD